MPDDAPTLIAIDPDDYHASHIGRTADGRQFFLTNPFETSEDRFGGCEFIALYLFDAAGQLLEAIIDSFGPRPVAEANPEAFRAVYEKHLSDLGTVSFERIVVAPFSAERFETVFGLVPRAPECELQEWTVEVMPGNYMAFFAPWDHGEYDT